MLRCGSIAYWVSICGSHMIQLKVLTCIWVKTSTNHPTPSTMSYDTQPVMHLVTAFQHRAVCLAELVQPLKNVFVQVPCTLPCPVHRIIRECLNVPGKSNVLSRKEAEPSAMRADWIILWKVCSWLWTTNLMLTLDRCWIWYPQWSHWNPWMWQWCNYLGAFDVNVTLICRILWHGSLFYFVSPRQHVS